MTALKKETKHKWRSGRHGTTDRFWTGNVISLVAFSSQCLRLVLLDFKLDFRNFIQHKAFTALYE